MCVYRSTLRESVVTPTRSTIISSVCCLMQAQVETHRASAATFRRTRALPSCASATSNATWIDLSEWGAMGGRRTSRFNEYNEGRPFFVLDNKEVKLGGLTIMAKASGKGSVPRRTQNAYPSNRVFLQRIRTSSDLRLSHEKRYHME